MNQSKFSLADIITLLASIGFGFFCFLSFNFLTMGETNKSILFAVVVAIILGGLAFGAKLLKRTDRNFKTCIIWECVLLFLFVIAAILAIKPFSHFFVVSAQKEEIQNVVTANIKQAEGLYDGYSKYADKRLELYKSRLNSVVNAKNINPSEYSEYGFEDGADDGEQIENKMFILKAKLYPSNYKDISTGNVAWMKMATSTVESWRPIGLVDIIKTVDYNLTSWKEDLIQYSKFRADGEVADDFDYPLSFNDVTWKMTLLSSPNWTSILYGVGLCFLMIVSYLVTKRHPRYPGLKVIFGNDKKECDKEL